MPSHSDHVSESISLAHLQPTHRLELYRSALKNSNRYHGSYRLNLRKNAKVSEYARTYAPGDPIHFIDWQAFARSDQLIVRQNRDEASCQTLIVVDIAPSMSWPDASIQKSTGKQLVQKTEIAMRCALNLAHIHLLMGDYTQLWLMQNPSSMPDLLLPLRSPKDVLSLYNDLANHNFTATHLLEQFAVDSDYALRRMDLAYFLSDALTAYNWEGILKVSAEFVFIQVCSQLELDLAWLGPRHYYFDNAWASKEMNGQKLLQKDSLQAALQVWRANTRDMILRSPGGHYGLVSDKTLISEFHSQLLF